MPDTRTQWWKAIKFWLTLVLAAYAAAVATYLLLRDREQGSTEQAAQPTITSLATAQDALRIALERVGASLDSETLRWVRARLEVDALLVPWTGEGPEDPACVVAAAALAGRLEELAARLGDGTPEQVLLRLERARPPTTTDFVLAVVELGAQGPAGAEALAHVHARYLEGPGRDDGFIRKRLGYQDYTFEVPGDLAFRRYDYVHAAERARDKRWFGPHEGVAYQQSLDAARETQAHYRRLVEDHRFRAVEEMRANLFDDPDLRGLHLVTRWVEPFLLCYLSDRPMGPHTRAGLPRDGEPAGGEALGIKAGKTLDAAGPIFRVVHHEFAKRYGVPLRLQPLMAPYGGRPDLPLGVRSYAEGCLAVVFVWGMERRAVGVHLDRLLPAGLVSWLDRDGRAHVLADAPGRARLQLRDTSSLRTAYAYIATALLHYWYGRQRNRWGHPRHARSFLHRGLPLWFGALRARNDGGWDFPGVSRRLLRELKGREAGRKVLPVRELVTPLPVERRYALRPDPDIEELVDALRAQALERWAGLTARQELESWMLVHFLNEHDGGRYRRAFLELFDLTLAGEAPHVALSRALALRTDGDWARLDEEFQAHVASLWALDPDDFD